MTTGTGRRARRVVAWNTFARVSTAVAVLVAASFVVVGQAVAALGDGRHRPAPTAGNVELGDDAVASLFSVANLHSGAAMTRCVRVSYRGPASGAAVRLFGSTTGTGLARALRLTVEAGSGGGFHNCQAFSGDVVYQGSLARFATDHVDGATGLPVFSPTEEAATKTFRFTLVLGDEPWAQGRTATAAFTWEASAVPSGPPASGVIPDGTVADDRTSTTAPGPASSQELVSGRPAIRPTAAADETASLLARMKRLAAEVARKAAFPLASLLVVVVFLLVQDRIDRKDPKLALAPVYAEPDLAFVPMGGPDR